MPKPKLPPLPLPVRVLQMVLIIMYKHRYSTKFMYGEVTPVILFEELLSECSRFKVVDKEEVKRVLRKLILDDCVRVEFDGDKNPTHLDMRYFSITYQGALHYLAGGYVQSYLNEVEKGQLARKAHALNEQAVDLQGQMKTLNTNMNWITGAIFVATAIQAVAALYQAFHPSDGAIYLIRLILP